MGLIKITADMTESERTAVINTNMQYLQLSNRLRKYPIGMIVAFATDIDPNKLYGGTWERIKGRVIWGIDDGETAGCTGGEKTHTLTEAELPAIDGKFATVVVSEHGSKGVDGHAYGANFGAVNATITGTTSGAGTQYGYGYKFGGGQPHNNMMPYYGAYVWRKTGHGIGEDPTLTEYEAFVQQMNTAISEALAKERLTTNATFSNALRGSASGSSVSLTDVSPNEHTLGVKVRGKNLLNADDIKNTQNANIVSKGNGACVIKLSSTDKTTTIANLYKGHLPVGTYYFTAKLKIENTLGSTRDNEILVFYNNTVITRWYEANSGDGEYNVSKSFNVTDPSSEVRIDFYPTVNSSSSTPTTEYQVTFTDIQLEYGNVATSYTPYISDLTSIIVTRYGTVETDSPQTYTPAADGTVSGVKSLYPTTTLMTDTVGAIIEAEYNRDINKAFAELQQAILSMGGNT